MLTTTNPFPQLPATALGALMFFGCGGAPGTHPDDMSAAEHRAAADSHDREAAEHEGQYDPDAVTTRPLAADYDFVEGAYNPTQRHAAAAGEHADVAEQHRRAAQALESYEEQECGSFPPSTRQLCPLLGQLVGAEDVDHGVRLQFGDGVNAEAAHAHVACHVAFARTQGREGMDHCPMYVDGVRAEQDESGATVLLVDEASSVAVVRRRTRAHLGDAP